MEKEKVKRKSWQQRMKEGNDQLKRDIFRLVKFIDSLPYEQRSKMDIDTMQTYMFYKIILEHEYSIFFGSHGKKV